MRNIARETPRQLEGPLSPRQCCMTVHVHAYLQASEFEVRKIKNVSKIARTVWKSQSSWKFIQYCRTLPQPNIQTLTQLNIQTLPQLNIQTT
jgi:hypothetical protein